jgi:ubiquitin fusion degradation protein 1
MFGHSEPFDEQYHCYSGAFADKPQLEGGDKILLPASAFEQLARLQISYPMLFELRTQSGKTTHCGVLEFTAAEGNVYIPHWMMNNLLLEEGSVLTVRNVSLPKATFVKFKPQHVDFLDISNPRAVLEKQLRHFSCVTVGDQICLPYNNRRYYLEIQEVKPPPAACIIECDCNVDFDAPVGYVEPDYKAQAAVSKANVPAPQKAKSQAREDEDNKPTEAFKAFAGGGCRLDGKELKATQASQLEAMPVVPTKAEEAKVWESSGQSVKGAVGASKKPRPAKKWAAASKWGKTNKAAFSGGGNSLK